MYKGTDDQVKDFVQRAIKAINKNLKLGLEFVNAGVFSNSCGTNLHMQFRDSDGEGFDIMQNGGLLQPDKKIGADVVANIPEQMPDEDKIILRIAYFIQLKYLREKRNK